MLSVMGSVVAFNVGPLLSTRASSGISMMALDYALETKFVYGPPVPASKGLPGFSNPTSFSTAEMEGMVVPTATAGAEPARAEGVAVSTLEDKFVYGPTVPASKGLPGFSNPTSFGAEAAEGEATPSARAEGVAVGTLEDKFVYGAPVPASKGLPGFSNPTSFSEGEVVPAASVRAEGVLVDALEAKFVYGPTVPASKGLPGFSNPTAFTGQ
jgi:hypothetical protein